MLGNAIRLAYVPAIAKLAVVLMNAFETVNTFTGGDVMMWRFAVNDGDFEQVMWSNWMVHSQRTEWGPVVRCLKVMRATGAKVRHEHDAVFDKKEGRNKYHDADTGKGV